MFMEEKNFEFFLRRNMLLTNVSFIDNLIKLYQATFTIDFTFNQKYSI